MCSPGVHVTTVFEPSMCKIVLSHTSMNHAR